MKILQLGKFYPLRGGVEVVMHKLALGLSERGIPCDLFYASRDGDTTDIELNQHCHIFRSKTLFEAQATMISPDMILKVRRMCRNYDIIHIHHPDPMAALALYLSGFRGKVVLHWHADIVRQSKLLSYYKPLQSWLIRRADLIVGTSPVYIKESEALHDVQHKTVVVPIGVTPPDTQYVAPTPPVLEQFSDRTIIFTLGRLVTYKGFEYLVEAAQWLPDDYVVLIGGDGNQRSALEAKIAAEGVGDKVKLLGFIPQDHLTAYFKACRLFCLSSVDKREAFAIVQIEAMAFGKPIVSTNIPGSGVPWVNKHGVSGLTVKPCDSRALADAIMLLCSDEERYSLFCRQARERYDKHFRYDVMINKMEAAYKQLVTT